MSLHRDCVLVYGCPSKKQCLIADLKVVKYARYCAAALSVMFAGLELAM